MEPRLEGIIRKEKRDQDLHSKKIYTVTIFRSLNKSDDENVLLATEIERIKNIITSWGTESVAICPIFIGIQNKTQFPRIKSISTGLTLILREDLDIPLEVKQEDKEVLIYEEIGKVEKFVSEKPDIKLVVFIVNVNEFSSDMNRLRTFMYKMLLPSSYLDP